MKEQKSLLISEHIKGNISEGEKKRLEKEKEIQEDGE